MKNEISTTIALYRVDAVDRHGRLQHFRELRADMARRIVATLVRHGYEAHILSETGNELQSAARIDRST